MIKCYNDNNCNYYKCEECLISLYKNIEEFILLFNNYKSYI